MTRRIAAHKGGRTARAPEARMTPQERGRLDAVLQRRRAKYVNWLIDHVEADYAEITGGNEMYHYAAESDKGLSMTYDSPCWQVLAFTSKAERDNYVKAHSDKAETVDYKTACKVAPQLRTEAPGKAWRTVLM